jgi:hypothetical protein
MKLAKHIRRLITVYGYRETIITRPKEVRQTLFMYDITPSLSQVKQAIRKHTQYILYGKTGLECQCGNPRVHDYMACLKFIDAERSGTPPDYHCDACQLYGDDRYADANGVVWVEGLMACEFKRRLIEQTRREDEQMRRDMIYAFGDGRSPWESAGFSSTATV